MAFSQQAGQFGLGLVFKIGTDGTGYQNLLSLDGPKGWAPEGSLVYSNSVLYESGFNLI